MTIGNVSSKVVGKDYVNLFSIVIPSNTFTINVLSETYAQGTGVTIPSIGVRDGLNLTSDYYYREIASTANFGYSSVAFHYDVDVPIGQTWYFDIEYLSVGAYNAQRTVMKKSSGVGVVSGGNNGIMNVSGGIRGYNSGTYNLVILTKAIFNHVG